jgi:hypothetical protein
MSVFGDRELVALRSDEGAGCFSKGLKRKSRRHTQRAGKFGEEK